MMQWSHLCNAQNSFVDTLPKPGTMVLESSDFVPLLVKGMVIHPDKPAYIDLIVDSGAQDINTTTIEEQTTRLANYFLTAVTVPEHDLWVNLSPDKKEGIMAAGLAQTMLGRDMLAQDYLLKQFTASMIYPEKSSGKIFWDKIYRQAYEVLGHMDVPVNVVHKVWIMPDIAEIYERGTAVYVTKARLKVMLEVDRLDTSGSGDGQQTDEKDLLIRKVFRDVIVPIIEKEVNEGANFSVVRQIYHAVILARWYRDSVQGTRFSAAFIGRNKVAGMALKEGNLKNMIYQRYLSAYKSGVFDYIREDYDRFSDTFYPKKYFSGGIADFAMLNVPLRRAIDASQILLNGQAFLVGLDLVPWANDNDSAQRTLNDNGFELKTQRLVADLEGRGIKDPLVDAYFVKIISALEKVNPLLNVVHLYRIYHDIVRKNPEAFAAGQGEVVVFSDTFEGHDRYRGQNHHTIIKRSPFLDFLKNDIGISEVTYHEEIQGGELSLDYHVQNPEHYVWEKKRHFYKTEPENDAILRFCVLVHFNDMRIRKILLGKEDDYKLMVESGIRVLGKEGGWGERGNKEKGFLLFEKLGLPYPPGIILSEQFIKTFSEMTSKERDNLMPFIHEALRSAGVNIKAERLSVRSNPKKSIPGLFKTRKNVAAIQLQLDIIEVARAWFSDRVTRLAQMYGLSAEYNLPIIIQKWVSGKTDLSLSKDGFYAAGVFSTRNPNTNANVLYGRYIEHSDGDNLMTEGKSGVRLQNLRKGAPNVYRQLLRAKKKLEDAAGPQEVEFVVNNGKVYFVQTRDLHLAPIAEISYIHESIKSGRISEARAIPKIEALQSRLVGRRSFTINKKSGPFKKIAGSLAHTSGAFQGVLVWHKDAAERLMLAGKPFIFVLSDYARVWNRNQFDDWSYGILSMIMQYPHSALITSYGNGSSHEAVLTRYAGIPALINLQGVVFDFQTFPSMQALRIGNINLREGSQVVIDADEGFLYQVPEVSASSEQELNEVLIEDSRIMDLSFGVHIPAYRDAFLSEYLDVHGQIKPEVTVENLEQLNKQALLEYQRYNSKKSPRKKFLANLRKHFLHDLLLRAIEESGGSDTKSANTGHGGHGLKGGIDIRSLMFGTTTTNRIIKFDEIQLYNFLQYATEGVTLRLSHISLLSNLQGIFADR